MFIPRSFAPNAIAPEETIITSLLRFFRYLTSSAKLTNQSKFNLFVSSSNNNDEPILITILLAVSYTHLRAHET